MPSINSLFDMSGKTALVTGSSRGLGYTFAEGFAAMGARVVIHGRHRDTLEKAASDLAKQYRGIETISFDVSKEESVSAAFQELDKRKIAVDILVNNAGIQHRQPLLDFSAADWQRVLDTNLTAAFLIGKEVARRMIARGAGGKIINITSLASELARPTVGPYTAAKGGLKLLTKAMTTEWAEHNIQVNAIGPGYMLTEMTQPLAEDPSFDGWVKNRTPSRRWGLPKDLMGVAIFLASPASDYVNGQTIYVDGGWLANM